MRRVREILRLKYECGATERAIAQSLGIARSTVAVTLDRLAAAELGWPLPASLSDKVLEAMLYAGPGTQRGSRRLCLFGAAFGTVRCLAVEHHTARST